MKIRLAPLALALVALVVSACGDSPVSSQTVGTEPDMLESVGTQSASGAPSSPEVAASGATSEVECNPQIEFLSGACADGPEGSGQPAHANIRGSCFSPGAEAAFVMSPNTNGFVKGGKVCNGIVLQIGEPFVLPPTFGRANEFGDLQVTVTGQECNVQAVDISSCAVSNVLTLPPVD